MKQWWEEMGFTKKGAKYAKAALPHATALVQCFPKDMQPGAAARAVLAEAIFRYVGLSKLTAKFQRRYKKVNGIK